MHPSTQALLEFFAYEHLPADLQQVSAPFCDLAHDVAHRLPDSPETTVCVRKLLEAKDCAVRAALPLCHDATLGDQRTAERLAHIDKVLVDAARGQGLRGQSRAAP